MTAGSSTAASTSTSTFVSSVWAFFFFFFFLISSSPPPVPPCVLLFSMTGTGAVGGATGTATGFGIVWDWAFKTACADASAAEDSDLFCVVGGLFGVVGRDIGTGAFFSDGFTAFPVSR